MATRAQDHLGPIGALVSAALVASCCLGPVLFLLFGASIGALSTLGTLEPYRPHFVAVDRKSTRLNSSHIQKSRMPSSA